MSELKEFARNRLSGLESAYTKISKNIEVIYNDNFVNFYANLENNAKNSNDLFIQKAFPMDSSRRFSRFNSMEESRSLICRSRS